MLLCVNHSELTYCCLIEHIKIKRDDNMKTSLWIYKNLSMNAMETDIYKFIKWFSSVVYQADWHTYYESL